MSSADFAGLGYSEDDLEWLSSPNKEGGYFLVFLKDIQNSLSGGSPYPIKFSLADNNPIEPLSSNFKIQVTIEEAEVVEEDEET